MSFISELNRRNVFRVIVLYVVSSWVILQAADVLSGILPVPEWTGSFVFLLLALAFPMVVIFSWVYEITPEGIKRERSVEPEESITHLTGRRLDILIGVIAVLAIVVVIVDRLVPESHVVVESSEATDPAESTDPVESTDPQLSADDDSIAILPFDDMSETGDQAYFSDGLAEELLNLLAKLPELKVASRTSSFSFRDGGADIRTIAAQLGVRYILEGSVRKQADRIRITTQLIDAETDFHVWSEVYEREQNDVFAIQDDIARNVVSALQLVISNRSETMLSRRSTEDIDAFEAYLRGRSFLRMPVSDETLASAEANFREAIELDADYADAHAGLCDTHRERFRVTSDMTAFESAEAACNRALALSPREPSVLISLGQLYRLSGEDFRAEHNFLRAIELDDRAADAYHGLARTYEHQNRFDEAYVAFQRAIDIQPGYWRAHMTMGSFLFRIGRSDEALSFMREAVDLSPNNPRALNSLGSTLYMLGAFDSARDAWYRSLQIDPTPIAFSNLGTASFYLQDFQQAAAMYSRAVELTPDDYQLWGALGDAYRFMPGSEADATSSYEKAIELAEAYLDLNADDGYALAGLAHYLASIGRADQAAWRLARAIELAPSNMYVHYFAALVAASSGDVDAAVNASRRALDNGYPINLLAAEPSLLNLAGSGNFRELLATDSSE
jgi:TolB-like protein/Flp pilus assembly protein TadD